MRETTAKGDTMGFQEIRLSRTYRYLASVFVLFAEKEEQAG
jgi:hypothetical protein